MVTVWLQYGYSDMVTARLQHGHCMVPARSLHGPCMVIARFGPSAVIVHARSQHGHNMVQSQSDTGTVTDRSTWSWSGTVRSVTGVRLVPASLHGCCLVKPVWSQSGPVCGWLRHGPGPVRAWIDQSLVWWRHTVRAFGDSSKKSLDR